MSGIDNVGKVCEIVVTDLYYGARGYIASYNPTNDRYIVSFSTSYACKYYKPDEIKILSDKKYFIVKEC